ncbi:MAG: hypothetical protein JWP74_3838 [Marmoricola sp.]|nr:hypothetical protein [Marmoricola sp.]
MLLAHAVTLAEVRSYLAAMADQAATFDGCVEYEHALLYLDLIHGDDIPALDTNRATDDRDILHAIAVSAVKELADHGVDKLHVELLLDMLDVARTYDNPDPDEF